jgi:SAM-dependent methyltransferase
MSQAARPPARELADMLAGAWLAQALAVVAKLGVADLLTAGPLAPAEIAAATATEPAAMYRVLRALAGAGVFVEDDRGRFGLTALAGPLRSDAADSIRAYAVMTGERWVWQSFGALEHSLRTGAPAFDHVFGAPLFDYYAAHPDAARVSADGLKSVGRGQDAAVLAAYDFSGAGTVVDVGGGQGGLLAAILGRFPQARGVLFDLPHVAAMARQAFAAAGLSARCRAEAGDFFSGVPEAGGIYLLRKVIHDWDDERARALLRTCRSAMREGSRLLLIEMVVPAGNVPAYAKLLDLLMLVYAGGRERTEAEFRNLLATAGFSVSRILPTASAVSIIEAEPAQGAL